MVFIVKTVTVKQAQTHLAEILRRVTDGEEVRLVEKRKPVAKIVPISGDKKSVDWQGTWERADAIFHGKRAPGKPGSRVVIEGRR